MILVHAEVVGHIKDGIVVRPWTNDTYVFLDHVMVADERLRCLRPDSVIFDAEMLLEQ